MKFRTSYDRMEIPSVHGQGEAPVYEPRYRDDGVLELEETGSRDLYSYIQSFKDSTDIHVIISRFVNGDQSALMKAQGVFMDTEGMPTTYADLLNTMIKVENAFDELPVEIKQRFDSNPHKWVASMDSPDFLEKMYRGTKFESTVFSKPSSVSSDSAVTEHTPAVSAIPDGDKPVVSSKEVSK